MTHIGVDIVKLLQKAPGHRVKNSVRVHIRAFRHGGIDATVAGKHLVEQTVEILEFGHVAAAIERPRHRHHRDTESLGDLLESGTLTGGTAGGLQHGRLGGNRGRAVGPQRILVFMLTRWLRDAISMPVAER